MSKREIDFRESDGLSVQLQWESESGEIYVSLIDSKLGQTEYFQVNPENALDAFWHPYAYVNPAAVPFDSLSV